MEKTGLVISDEEQHDGLVRSLNGEYLNLPIMHEISPFVVEYEIPDKALVSRKTYKHVSQHWYHEDKRNIEKFDFWVPIEEDNPYPYIMKKLIKNYIK